ncbi:MAG: carbonic anhydrase [Gammaproteobacteria bacterium]|nr:carbonic anhydrase [Gammaproteobacteria bacterium]
MDATFHKMLQGYRGFREKYVRCEEGVDSSLMHRLAVDGQSPEVMVVACSDARVDPALILQCEPGDLFVVRNVANLIPPNEPDASHHGTSAALEFGVCNLNVKHLIILGHSQCGGMDALLNRSELKQNDFITNWMSLIDNETDPVEDVEILAKRALLSSYENCLTFPWIRERVRENKLKIDLWFFEIKTGEISAYSFKHNQFQSLVDDND